MRKVFYNRESMEFMSEEFVSRCRAEEGGEGSFAEYIERNEIEEVLPTEEAMAGLLAIIAKMFPADVNGVSASDLLADYEKACDFSYMLQERLFDSPLPRNLEEHYTETDVHFALSDVWFLSGAYNFANGSADCVSV